MKPSAGSAARIDGNPPPLICPVCALPLPWGDQASRCPQGHSFDRAREGYLNLLLSHHRRSANPGDSAEMVRARRRIFDSGALSALVELVRTEVAGLLSARVAEGPAEVVDSGCGEGHLLGALQGDFTSSPYGLDLSREAIRLAARRHAGCRWIVANTMRTIPFASDSVRLLLSVLAPRNVDEFRRILNSHGHLILVVPGPDHLVEARSVLTEDAADYRAKADEAVALCAPRFAQIQRRTLTFDHMLNSDLLQDLVQMTPLFWRSALEAKNRLSALGELRVTMSFVLLTFTPVR